MAEIIIVIVSIFITAWICKRVFRNTIGTTKAYVVRVFVIWVIVAGVISCIANALGII